MPWIVLPSGERVPLEPDWKRIDENMWRWKAPAAKRPIVLAFEHYNLDAAALRWLDAFLATIPGGRLRVAELLD